MQTVTKNYIQVVHEYTPMIAPGVWGPTEIKYNNRREITPVTPAKIQNYLNAYADRLDAVHEFDFKRLFEGKYGYRWKDIRIEVVTETTKIKTLTVSP